MTLDVTFGGNDGCKMSLNLRHDALKCQRSGDQGCIAYKMKTSIPPVQQKKKRSATSDKILNKKQSDPTVGKHS